MNFLWIIIQLILTYLFGGIFNFSWIDEYLEKDEPKQIVIDEPDKPEMTLVEIDSDSSETTIKNVYKIAVLISDTVGIVGVPILVENVSESDHAVMTFHYVEEELTCDENELIIMYYNEELGFYEIVNNYKVNEEADTISFQVKKEGTYVLEDSVIWTAAWNGTYDGYEEPMEPECDWHKEFAYQDIEMLADIEIYDESGEYHITTINQLAGLVKLVNEGRDFDGCVFYLDSDLDLEGYRWVPIGWYKPADNGYTWKDFPFSGKFYGNGHVIYNLTIDEPDHCDIGLFGRTMSNFEVHDLGLVNCDITGKYYVGAFLGDNINPGEGYGMTNCFATGQVKGQLTVGSLVGSSAYLNMKDCYAWMEEGDVAEIAADLRGGSLENCHMNDAASERFLYEYIVQ